MGVLAVVGAVLVVAYFLIPERLFASVTSRIVGGQFCPPDYIPQTVGVAPGWMSNASRARFFIDPQTACTVISSPELLRRAELTVLTEPEHIARFLNLNGDPVFEPVLRDPVDEDTPRVLGTAIYLGGQPTCPIGYHVEMIKGIDMCVKNVKLPPGVYTR